MSLHLWRALNSAKQRMAAFGGDAGAGEFIAVIVIIVIVLLVGAALGPFKQTIIDQFNNISAGIAKVGQ